MATTTTPGTTNIECDLCHSTLAYNGKRPARWADVYMSPTRDRTTMYSVRPDTEYRPKHNLLCPRCTSWIMPLLPDDMAHDYAAGKKKR